MLVINLSILAHSLQQIYHASILIMEEIIEETPGVGYIEAQLFLELSCKSKTILKQFIFEK